MTSRHHESARPIVLGILFSVFACGMQPTSASAEVFLLVNEGRIEGTLLNPNELPRRAYVIGLEGGTRITLASDRVAKVVRITENRAEYERIKPTYPDTIEGQWAIAEWCLAHHLTTLRRAHLERIIELDPDHKQARSGLGYSRVDGQWKTRSQVKSEQGYVLDGGEWKLPQEIEAEARHRKDELAQLEWIKTLSKWHEALADPVKAQDAAAKISGIDDPYAVKALRKMLESEQNDAYRVLAIEALSRIKSPEALVALAETSLVDPVEEIRLTAIDSLVENQSKELVGFYIRALRNKDNNTINRAAVALSRFKDTSAIAPLIDALITTHKFQVTQGDPNATTATFARPNSNGVITNPPGGFPSGSGGGGGMAMTMGNSTRVVTQRIPNQAVLDALIAMTQVNFDFNIRHWKHWFASQKKSESLDARRDSP